MIEAVLFDYGGVLTNLGQKDSLNREIAQHFTVNESDFDVQDLVKRWQLGAIGAKRFFGEVNRRYSGQSPYQDLAFKYNLGHFAAGLPGLYSDQTFLSNMGRENIRLEKMHKLIEKIRRKGIRTGILSNTVTLAAQRIKEAGGYEGFDPVILSYQARMVKPNPGIYKLAAKEIGANPENIVFVDDDPKNLEPARAMGMFTVHAVSEKQLLIALPAIFEDRNGIEI